MIRTIWLPALALGAVLAPNGFASAQAGGSDKTCGFPKTLGGTGTAGRPRPMTTPNSLTGGYHGGYHGATGATTVAIAERRLRLPRVLRWRVGRYYRPYYAGFPPFFGYRPFYNSFAVYNSYPSYYSGTAVRRVLQQVLPGLLVLRHKRR